MRCGEISNTNCRVRTILLLPIKTGRLNKRTLHLVRWLLRTSWLKQGWSHLRNPNNNNILNGCRSSSLQCSNTTGWRFLCRATLLNPSFLFWMHLILIPKSTCPLTHRCLDGKGLPREMWLRRLLEKGRRGWSKTGNLLPAQEQENRSDLQWGVLLCMKTVLLLIPFVLGVLKNFQAYTHELEIKISRLEEENERLRRQKVGFTIFPLDASLIFILAWCSFVLSLRNHHLSSSNDYLGAIGEMQCYLILDWL